MIEVSGRPPKLIFVVHQTLYILKVKYNKLSLLSYCPQRNQQQSPEGNLIGGEALTSSKTLSRWLRLQYRLYLVQCTYTHTHTYMYLYIRTERFMRTRKGICMQVHDVVKILGKKCNKIKYQIKKNNKNAFA